MKRSIRKFWLEPDLVIRGAEGESDGNGGSETGSDGDGSTNDDAGGSGDQSSEDDAEEDDDDDQETFTKEDVAALKKALKEERTAKKEAVKAKRTLERAQKSSQDTAQKTEADEKSKEADERVRKAEERATKLAEGYRTARVESVITKLAQVANIVNPEDMVALLKAKGYADIDIDQDEDDPSKVDVDEDEVKEAIKKALKTRKHWVKSNYEGDDAGAPSGSKMRPGSQRKESLDDEALKQKYPALRMRR